MDLAVVDKIAKAVLYEGYMLYPYRPSSVKNQQRWNFGVLCPPAYSEAQQGSESSAMQTECLIEGDPRSGIEIRVRFLQLVARSVAEVIGPAEGSAAAEGRRSVERLEVNGRVYQPWQEAVERDLTLRFSNLEFLRRKPIARVFCFQAEEHRENLFDGDKIAGVIVRKRNAISGIVEVGGVRIHEGVYRLRVVIRNVTPFEEATKSSRDQALLSSMVSAHTVLGVEGGRFVSLLAPEDRFSDAAAACKNVGTWPVLVGEEGERDTILSSPIILYDYPQIAPESVGDLFDGTEIDEILSLRIMTLTDDEKREMSQSDERAREMLERTEAMPVEQLMKLHGVLRGLRPLKEESQ